MNDSNRDGGERQPMSDDRLLQIKRALARWVEHEGKGMLGVCLDPESPFGMLGNTLDEIDLLRHQLKLARPEPPLGPKPDRFRTEVREAFLREAIIELGSALGYRRSDVGEWVKMQRTPGECAHRARELWEAYRDILREPGSG